MLRCCCGTYTVEPIALDKLDGKGTQPYLRVRMHGGNAIDFLAIDERAAADRVIAYLAERGKTLRTE